MANLGIVVAMPSADATKEGVQFYVGDLLSRMKTGDSDLTREALVKLNEFVNRDEGLVKVVVEIEGVVNLLVGFLASLVDKIQEEATTFLVLVSSWESCKGVLTGDVLIDPLISVLWCGTDLAREGCARCLENLTQDLENVRLFFKYGGVFALNICIRGDFGEGLIIHACRVLKNLVVVEDAKSFMIEQDVITIVIRLLESENVAVEALELGLTLCDASDEVKKLLGKAGFMEELVRFLEAKWQTIRKLAAGGLQMMILVPKNKKKFLQNDQNVASLVCLLDEEGNNRDITNSILSLLMSLADSSGGRSKINNAGCLSKIKNLVGIEACKQAAKRLAWKLSVDRSHSC